MQDENGGIRRNRRSGRLSGQTGVSGDGNSSQTTGGSNDRLPPRQQPQPAPVYSAEHAAGEINGHRANESRENELYFDVSAAQRENAPLSGKNGAKSRRGKKKSFSTKLLWLACAIFAVAAVAMIVIGIFTKKDAKVKREPVIVGTESAGVDALAGYTRGYSRYIFRYAQEYDLPYAYVAAIIKNESNYDKNAVSRVGARGLMQLMPKTGTWAAEQMKLTDYTEDSLFDAATNIRIGTWYLKWIGRHYFGDDYLLITCAYHAGQGNVKSWLKNYSTDGKTLTIDQIPMDDTKVYVRRVMNSYAVYSNRIYNFLYEDEIRSSARRNGLPSALVAAVIMQASAYDETLILKNGSDTVSEQDAFTANKYGLMQISRTACDLDSGVTV